jgi:hypothetical protein
MLALHFLTKDTDIEQLNRQYHAVQLPVDYKTLWGAQAALVKPTVWGAVSMCTVPLEERAEGYKSFRQVLREEAISQGYVLRDAHGDFVTHGQEIVIDPEAGSMWKELLTKTWREKDTCGRVFLDNAGWESISWLTGDVEMNRIWESFRRSVMREVAGWGVPVFCNGRPPEGLRRRYAGKMIEQVPHETSWDADVFGEGITRDGVYSEMLRRWKHGGPMIVLQEREDENSNRRWAKEVCGLAMLFGAYYGVTVDPGTCPAIFADNVVGWWYPKPGHERPRIDFGQDSDARGHTTGWIKISRDFQHVRTGEGRKVVATFPSDMKTCSVTGLQGILL